MNISSLKYGSVAQLEEQWTVNPWVEGSNPSRSAKLSLLKIKFFEILVAEEEGYIYCIEEVIP